MAVDGPQINTLKEGLLEERDKLQKHILETIQDFENRTGCYVVDMVLVSHTSGQTKTNNVLLRIGL